MKILKYWKPLLVACIILYGSLSSGEQLNQVNLLNFKYSDKVIHFILYFGFSLTLISSFYNNSYYLKWKRIILSLGILIIYGMLMEFFQYQFTSTRSAEFLDIIANTLGAITGILIFPLILKYNLNRLL